MIIKKERKERIEDTDFNDLAKIMYSEKQLVLIKKKKFNDKSNNIVKHIIYAPANEENWATFKEKFFEKR